MDNKFEQLKDLSNWDLILAPGMHPSMSMTGLVIHLESRISEQRTSTSPTLTSEEWQSLQILDDVNRALFNDVQNLPGSDEKSLVSRVKSLCRLIRNDKKAENDGNECGPSNMSRKDSLEEFLLNLPSITSLPRLLSERRER